MKEILETFIGRLGKDPELKYTKTQVPVCNMSVATADNNNEKTIWKKVVVWGEHAEQCKAMLEKGKQVFVHGPNVIGKYEDREGNIKSYSEIRAYKVGFPERSEGRDEF